MAEQSASVGESLKRILGEEEFARRKELHALDPALPLETELLLDDTGHLRTLEELLLNLEEELLAERFLECQRELRIAEGAGDIERTQKLLEECNTLSRSINSIKKRRTH